MVTIVPQTFEPFINMVKSLLVEGKFNPKLRETAILRVAYLTHASYEWHQHSFIAKANGAPRMKLK
jgi:alkylhydroperoxidase family enzyme